MKLGNVGFAAKMFEADVFLQIFPHVFDQARQLDWHDGNIRLALKARHLDE